MTNSILVYDDDPARVAEWRDRLLAIPQVKKAFEIQGVDDKEFNAGMKELQARRAVARNGPSKRSNGEVSFDTAAILVIDYDLLRIEHPGYLTGEAVAYLARCYSNCGIIVALNQFGENPFDLTLRGHPESYADLNLGSKQLDNLGLWTDSWSGFRPWQWPLLPQVENGLGRRMAELETKLDAPIVRHLGLSDSVIRALPLVARDFLTRREPVEEVTFRSFALTSGQGFRSRDKPLNEEQLARVAASRIAHWVESYLMPGQDILVDGPHLAYRYPSLLTGDRSRLQSWNLTSRLSEDARSALHRQVLDDFAFTASWASRPTWSWAEVSRCEAIKEVKEPWSIERPEWVFCEDLSRFLPADAAREFVADVESPFARRYVGRPQSEHLTGLRNELLAVDYRPQERLYL